MVDSVSGYLAFGLFMSLVVVLALALKFAKDSGKSKAERDFLIRLQKRRDAFDKAIHRPLASGGDLIRRMRERVDK